MTHWTASLGRAAALACLALLCGSARAADNQLSAQEKASGWQLLFDGRTFAGWEDPAKKSPPGDSFVIAGGCLKATARPRISEDLFTRDTYRDFELEFDWRIAPGGNSGVKYRIQDRVFLLDGNFPRFEDQVNASLRKRRAERPEKGQEYVIGFEYQVLDNALNPDAKNGTTHQAGALYDVAAPSKDATRPVGEFNHSRLVVRGDHLEHWLNGVKVVAASLSGPEVAASAARRWGVGSPVYELLVRQPRRDGQISLQNHNSEAWFRNIKIRRLK
jgi:hypothetical protein